MTLLQSSLDPQRRADLRRMLVAQAEPRAEASPRRRLVLAGAAATVVVATGAVTYAVFPDPPPANYAAWTAVPQAAPPLTAEPQDIEQWASKCSDLGVGGVGVGGVPARPEAAARRDVLVDRRGGFTFCVDVALGSGTERDPLIALSGLKAGGRNGLNTTAATVSDKPFALPRGGDVLVLGGSLDTPFPDREEGVTSLEAVQLFGLSGPDVTGVDVVLTNGLRVTATLRHGVWGLWWPRERGESAGCRLEIHTAAGATSVDPRALQLPIG